MTKEMKEEIVIIRVYSGARDSEALDKVVDDLEGFAERQFSAGYMTTADQLRRNYVAMLEEAVAELDRRIKFIKEMA